MGLVEVSALLVDFILTPRFNFATNAVYLN